ncbi:MAG: hypothetical protein AAF290_05660 [Pseudomonadota bacterium]
MTNNDTRKGRLQLILLALVFFGPLLVAILMYFGGAQPDGKQVNYGQFIEPPISLDAKLHFDTGLRGRWTLIYKTAAPCEETCERALIDIRQIRLATGREIERIERLLVSESAVDTDALLAAHPGLAISSSLATVSGELHRALDPLPAEQLYIMDPLGNVILRYDLEPDRKKFLGDLKKLLKFSRIG